jgi:hypothetical protein
MVQIRPSRCFGAPPPGEAQSRIVTTAEQQRQQVDEAAVVEWRFARLLHAGYSPEDAWTLAACRHVDVGLAERLLAEGCVPATAVRILV